MITQRYARPLSFRAGAFRASVGVCPSVQFIHTPLRYTCHWYFSPSPVAATVKLASSPSVMMTLSGWPVMTGAACTVSAAGWLATTVP